VRRSVVEAGKRSNAPGNAATAVARIPEIAGRTPVVVLVHLVLVRF
jgi:hypothetical protein